MSPEDAIEFRTRRLETDVTEHAAELRELREAVAVVPSLVESVKELRAAVNRMSLALYSLAGGVVIAAVTFAASVATGAH